MPIDAYELFRQIDDATATASSAVEVARQKNLQAPRKLRALARRQTDALVDLSQHYLPDLTHQVLADTWHEVRDQIRDLLLLKDDECRRFRLLLREARSRHEQFESRLESLRQRFERARLDLSSKTGHFKKMLRLDPATARCMDAITKVDQEIDLGLAQSDAATCDAKRKLPDYEACSLFCYLRDRNYGTTLYKGRGLERRWDRWVAKLVDYEKAKASFDYLNDAPVRLQSLIDEKRDHYRALLQHLENARDHAMTRFGVQAQENLWTSLGEQIEELEQEVEQTRREEAGLQDQLQEAENINGAEYRQSVEIYRQFLADLDPEIMRVYAACTESPVDDEICARLRRIQHEIEVEQRLSKNRSDQIIELEKYVSGLDELADRLRIDLRQTPGNVEVCDDFRLEALLSDMRHHNLTPGQVWRRLRASMILDAVPADEHQSASPLSMTSSRRSETRPLEASFLAASRLSSSSVAPRVDLTGIVLFPRRKPSADDAAHKHQFSTLARCASQADASYVTSLLEPHGIRCFAHTRLVSRNTQPAGLVTSEELQVMVETNRFAEARQLVKDQQQEGDAKWTCNECHSKVDAGYHRCWRCRMKRLHA